jgi:hypothetical protein
MEMTVTGSNKGAGFSPEQWAPGRTLDSIKAMPLTVEDIAEAGQLLGISGKRASEELIRDLQSIARRYREQSRDAERPPADWYRTQIGGIQNHAEAVLKLLRSAKGTSLSQLKWRIRQQMKRPLLGRSGYEAPSVEQFLEDFVHTCKSCTYQSSRGAPEKTAIKIAVASLRRIWVNYSGRDFPVNLQTADNRVDRGDRLAADQDKDEVFTSPGPSFVQIMMRKVDPEVGTGAIKTALRQASVNARSVD